MTSSERPRWWGPDWRGLPAATWLTLLVGLVAGYAVASLMLHQFAPGLFSVPRSVRGLTRGEWLSCVLAGIGAAPFLLIWEPALRRRGYKLRERHRREPGSVEDRRRERELAARLVVGCAFLTVAASVGAIIAPQVSTSLIFGGMAVLTSALTAVAVRRRRRYRDR